MSKEAAFLETLVKEAYKKITSLERDLESARQPTPPEPIAIVGMGCRFPGADSPEAYWQLLIEGRSAVRTVLPARWDLARYAALAAANVKQESWCRGGFLDQVDHFDPRFFRISPLEAITMDPQQRLLLEVTWEALEHAAIAPDSLAGSRTGVFVGMTAGQSMGDSGAMDPEQAMYIGTGNTPSIAAGRLSYVLGLQGPCFALDTACSSAMMATHVAVGNLRAGECDLALAGGVNVLTPEGNVLMANAGWLASDGRCKTFDAAADGHARGEGCGIVVLKRLSDAQRDGDKIWALIRGSASNHDGRTSGLTVPNGPAQQALIRQALANGGVQPAEISYSEAHATGTALGDGIEVGALSAVYAEREVPLLIGSVKPNLGHLEGASGASSLIKLVLALYHGELAPHIGMKEPNPAIPWAELPIEVVTARRSWPKNPLTTKRLGGVSGFGFSGTNIHLILEEPPAVNSIPPLLPSRNGEGGAQRGWHLFALSAKDENARKMLAERYANHLADHPELSLSELCYTANRGRNHFAHRLAVGAATIAELQDKLAAFAAGKRTMGLVMGQERTSRPQIAFLFSGLGGQAVGMGRQLYATAPIFRAAIDRCEQLLQGSLALPLTQVLYHEEPKQAAQLLTQAIYAEPALFAVEYALAMLWQSWGIKPDVVLGHSLGEYVAACVAGVLALEDALMLVVERARLIEAASHGGATAAIFANADQVSGLMAPFADDVSIAGINSPEETLIAGPGIAVDAIIAAAQAAGFDGKRLNVAHAAHSPLMEPVLAQFDTLLQRVKFRTPRMKLISSVTGAVCNKLDATHWRRHLREPVRFAQSIATLQESNCTLMVEIGPQPVLLWLGRQNWRGEEAAQWLPSLWAIHDDWKQLLQSLAELYTQGVAVDWSALYPRDGHQKLVLPTYPFQRKRYWIDPPAAPRIGPSSNLPTATNGALASAAQEAQVATGALDAPAADSAPLSLVQLAAATVAERSQLILTFLQEQVAATLYLAVTEVEPTTNLVELGMDSVMAMRILNACRDSLGFVLYPRDLYDRPVLQNFAKYLAAEYERLHGAGETIAELPGATGPAILATVAERTFTVPAQKNPPMIFLLSAPRSGSTLLRVMLAGHPDLFAPPELHLLWLEQMAEFPHLDYLGEGLQRTLMALHGLDAGASQAMIDRWVAEKRPIQEIYRLLQATVAPRLLIDKSPTYGEHLHVLQRIEQLFDQPRYIHLVRHPYAVIDSYVRNRMDRIGGDRGQDAFAVAEAVWHTANGNIQTVLAAIDSTRQCTLHYEDLLRDPVLEMQRVADFLAVPYLDALIQPYNGERMTDGVHANSIPLGDMNFAGRGELRPEMADAWRTVRLPRALQEETIEMAHALGYELPHPLSIASTAALVPDLSPSTSATGSFVMRKRNGRNGTNGHQDVDTDSDIRGSSAVPTVPLSIFNATQPEMPATLSARREHTIDLRGLKLCLCEWGPESGPTVVCVHGLLDHGAAWEAVAQPLAAAGYHVVAPDLRGHGRSDHVGVGGSYQLLDFVSDLDGVMRALNVNAITLVGHSMGSSVALLYAAARPQQIAQLVLIEPYVPLGQQAPPLLDQLVTQLDYRAMQLQHPVFPDVAAAAAYLRQHTSAFTQATAERTADRLTIPSAAGVTWRWDVALSTRSTLATHDEGGESNYLALLAEIQVPVTVVYGTASHAYRPAVKSLWAEKFPAAHLLELTGSHHLQLDQAQALAQIVAHRNVPQPLVDNIEKITKETTGEKG